MIETRRYNKTQAKSQAEPITKCYPNATLEVRGVPQGPVRVCRANLHKLNLSGLLRLTNLVLRK